MTRSTPQPQPPPNYRPLREEERHDRHERNKIDGHPIQRWNDLTRKWEDGGPAGRMPFWDDQHYAVHAHWRAARYRHGTP